MSDGTPTGPGQPRMPWEPAPTEGEAPQPPAPRPPGWTPPESTDPTTAWTPPQAVPASPPAGPAPAAPPPGQGGLISSAPSGWGSPQPVATEVAPGLTFADTPSRVVAYIIDWIILIFAITIVAAVLGSIFAVTTSVTDSNLAGRVGGATGSIIFALIGLAYFVGSWTGGRRATIGQRAMNIQVGNAFDGRPLSLEQAIRRWLGLGSWIALLGILPSLVSASGLMQSAVDDHPADLDRDQPHEAGLARSVRQHRARSPGGSGVRRRDGVPRHRRSTGAPVGDLDHRTPLPRRAGEHDPLGGRRLDLAVSRPAAPG